VRLNVSFGQRRDGSASRRIRQVQSSAAVSKPEPEGRSPVLVMAGIAAGLLCVALLGYGYVNGAPQVGKKLSETVEAQLNVSGSLKPEAALLKTSAAEDWSLGNCNMPKPLSGADFTRTPETPEDTESLAGTMKQMAGGAISESFVHRAEFLECVVSNEAERLCKADVREAFAADVSVFYHDIATISALMVPNAAQQDPNAAVALSRLTSEVSEGPSEFAEGRSAVAKDYSDAKDKVDDALQEAISNGYVSESDFGWMTPTPVHEVFKRSKVKTAACQQHQ
jgi:hypothetical protein